MGGAAGPRGFPPRGCPDRGRSGREATWGEGAALFQLPQEANLRSDFPRPPASWSCYGFGKWLVPPVLPAGGEGTETSGFRPQVHSMSSSSPAAEGEGTPDQPASEKEPEIPDPREESEEEDDDDEEDDDEEEEKGGDQVVSLSDGFSTKQVLFCTFCT